MAVARRSAEVVMIAAKPGVENCYYKFESFCASLERVVDAHARNEPINPLTLATLKWFARQIKADWKAAIEAREW
jgi:hypothetical protein